VTRVPSIGRQMPLYIRITDDISRERTWVRKSLSRHPEHDTYRAEFADSDLTEMFINNRYGELVRIMPGDAFVWCDRLGGELNKSPDPEVAAVWDGNQIHQDAAARLAAFRKWKGAVGRDTTCENIMAGMMFCDPVTGTKFRLSWIDVVRYEQAALCYFVYEDGFNVKIIQYLPAHKLGDGIFDMSNTLHCMVTRALAAGPDAVDPLTNEVLALRKKVSALNGKINELLMEKP
jgi:hypothetical protein